MGPPRLEGGAPQVGLARVVEDERGAGAARHELHHGGELGMAHADVKGEPKVAAGLHAADELRGEAEPRVGFPLDQVAHPADEGPDRQGPERRGRARAGVHRGEGDDGRDPWGFAAARLSTPLRLRARPRPRSQSASTNTASCREAKKVPGLAHEVRRAVGGGDRGAVGEPRVRQARRVPEMHVRVCEREPHGQSWWKTSSIRAHQSPGAREGRGSCMGSITAHHRRVSRSAAISFMSASKSSPQYSK